ncbi:MAG: hypothetical protein K9L26_01975 [Candidatus Izimaplasma sp.]|nr:hypothetical protein [Candidatus Izimaplasma bacterium]
MKTLEKSLHLQQLYDFYGKLLTNKQKAYFEAYYFNDYSITEIAENHSVSRNAVFDQLKRVEAKLLEYETLLKLHDTHQLRMALYHQIEKSETIDETKKLVTKLKEIE